MYIFPRQGYDIIQNSTFPVQQGLTIKKKNTICSLRQNSNLFVVVFMYFKFLIFFSFVLEGRKPLAFLHSHSKLTTKRELVDDKLRVS